MKKLSISLEYCLLGFLKSGPVHGYSLYQLAQSAQGLGMIWHFKISQLYALLDKLEKAELVTSSLISQEPHPPRRVFTLTEKGLQTYQKWLITPAPRPHQMRQEFLARLYFALQEDPSQAIMLIEQQRKIIHEWLETLQRNDQKPAAGSSFSSRVTSYRLGQVQATLDWLDMLHDDLSKSGG